MDFKTSQKHPTMDSNKPNPNPNPTSMRVLIRPPSTPPPPSKPPSSSSSSPPPPPRPPPPPHPQPQHSPGVVVVGFIGRRINDVSHLINRILDSNVFGSTRKDTPFKIDELTKEAEVWLMNRGISYYYDEQNCLMFLQLSSFNCPALCSDSGVDSVVEEHEFGDLQGMLFMFTVSFYFFVPFL